VIIQSFEYELSCEDAPFFAGDAVFGYFTAGALQQQTGLDGGQQIPTWGALHPAVSGFEVALQRDPRLFGGTTNDSHLRLPGGHFDLLDRAFVVPTGGTFGKGYVECSRTVRAGDWFFDCHFFQDPVMPGSLGVEALIQALKIFALEQKLGERLSSPCFSHVSGEETVWKYRGQIVRETENMHVEVHIRDIEERNDCTVLRADGSLWRDGLRIYEVMNLTLAVSES
jgi:3-hydroxymyristoyl/3-hydroxydecanoyl-(acyl carrier protein) dehydratase